MLVLNNEASIHAQSVMCFFVLNVIEAKCELKGFLLFTKGLLIGAYFIYSKLRKQSSFTELENRLLRKALNEGGQVSPLWSL